LSLGIGGAGALLFFLGFAPCWMYLVSSSEACSPTAIQQKYLCYEQHLHISPLNVVRINVKGILEEWCHIANLLITYEDEDPELEDACTNEGTMEGNC
jgi:hypothetical protein